MWFRPLHPELLALDGLAAATAAEAEAGSSTNAADLPYNGDIQAAMRAQDRTAIRQLMAIAASATA